VFSARITALGSGELNFEVYQDDFRMATVSGARATNGSSWLVDAKKGGRGFSVRRLAN
jgi:hypothetical protein